VAQIVDTVATGRSEWSSAGKGGRLSPGRDGLADGTGWGRSCRAGRPLQTGALTGKRCLSNNEMRFTSGGKEAVRLVDGEGLRCVPPGSEGRAEVVCVRGRYAMRGCILASRA